MITLNRYLDVGKEKPIKLQGKINPSFKCRICKDLMFNPVQTGCGELACKMCYEEKKINGVCPLEGEEYDGSTCSFFLDKCIMKQILKMEVDCPNEQCDWKGKLSELRKEHFDQCKEELQTCELCYEEVNKLKRKFHMDEKNDKLVTNGSLADHIKRCKMIKPQVVCPLQQMGCQFQVDYHIGNRLATSGYKDLVLLMSKNHELEYKVKELTEKLQAQKLQVQKLQALEEKSEPESWEVNLLEFFEHELHENTLLNR